jgi:hypothetical protein
VSQGEIFFLSTLPFDEWCGLKGDAPTISGEGIKDKRSANSSYR